MIRPAAMADLPALERMLLAFHAESRAPVAVDAYDRSHFGATVSALLVSPRGYVAVLDLDGPRGVLMAMAAVSPLMPVLVADELMWWVDPASRGRWALAMLRHYEAWARGVGAAVVGVSAYDERGCALHARRGYAPFERKFGKAA